MRTYIGLLCCLSFVCQTASADIDLCSAIFISRDDGASHELIIQIQTLREQIEEARIVGEIALARLLYSHYQKLIADAHALGLTVNYSAKANKTVLADRRKTEEIRTAVAKERAGIFTYWHVIHKAPAHADTRNIRISSDKNTLLIADSHLKVINLKTAKEEWLPYKYGTHLYEFDVEWNSRTVVVMSESNYADDSRLPPTAQFFQLSETKGAQPVTGFPEDSNYSAFDISGQIVAHLIKNKIVIQSVDSKKILSSHLNPWNEIPKSLRFSPNGKMLIKTDHHNNEDVLDLTSGQLITPKPPNMDTYPASKTLKSLFRDSVEFVKRRTIRVPGNRVAFSNKAGLFAYADPDGRGWIQTPNSGRIELATDNEKIVKLRFSPKDDFVFATLKSGTLLAFETTTGILLRGITGGVKSFEMTTDQLSFVYLDNENVYIEAPL